MDRLKLCPYCGGTPFIKSRIFHATDVDFVSGETFCTTTKRYCVRCNNTCCPCRPQTRLFSTPEKAIEAWNRRADNG